MQRRSVSYYPPPWVRVSLSKIGSFFIRVSERFVRVEKRINEAETVKMALGENSLSLQKYNPLPKVSADFTSIFE